MLVASGISEDPQILCWFGFGVGKISVVVPAATGLTVGTSADVVSSSEGQVLVVAISPVDEYAVYIPGGVHPHQPVFDPVFPGSMQFDSPGLQTPHPAPSFVRMALISAEVHIIPVAVEPAFFGSQYAFVFE
jgi:hypothetical protein